MSREEDLTWGKLSTVVFGVILLALGLMLTYFSLQANIELVSTRIFTPIGLTIALVGGFMIVARGG